MRIVLIAAVARNGVIGCDGGLPWHLPSDLRHFRQRTMGRPVIMGRRTFETIGVPLPGRTNIVMTRSGSDVAPGVRAARDLSTALAIARDAAGDDGGDVFIAGGGEIYRAALPVADVLDLTEVDMEAEGDAVFPRWPRECFRMVEDRFHPPDERHACAMRFRRYERKEKQAPTS